MRQHIETDLVRLKRRIAKLSGNARAWSDPLEVEALAEAHFRLGTHPETPDDDALAHLHQAAKLDGANPKLAYHLALFFLAHNALERAAYWFERAHRLCPTSHRLWTHVGLLQLELNGKFHGDSRYQPNALRKMGETVFGRVKNGDDDIATELLAFKPTRSLASIEAEARQRGGPADTDAESVEASSSGVEDADPPRRRLSEPGRCRYQGVEEIQIELLLEASPSERNRNALLDLLEPWAATASQRRGGTGALAIAAIQWLLRGYPVASVRRLRSSFDGLDPALELLDLVCELCETDEAQLPGRLNELLFENRLPPLLAALLHQHQILWRPLQPRRVAIYRAAKAYFDNRPRKPPSDEASIQTFRRRALDHIKNLEDFARGLETRPPKPLEDAPPEERHRIPVETMPKRLRELEQQIEEIPRQLDLQWAELKALGKKPTLGPDQHAALAETAEYVEIVGTLCDKTIAELEKLRQGAKKDDIARIDQLQSAYREPLGRLGAFKKRFKKLGISTNAASATASTAASGHNGTPGEPVSDPHGFIALERALEKAEGVLVELYLKTFGSFDAYSSELLRHSALQTLADMTRNRAARMSHRLGRDVEARRLWNGILRHDGLNLEALKNLAISATSNADAVRALDAWRSYAEALYFYDIVAGSPRPRAQARVDLHREIGNAYAPRFLRGLLVRDWDKEVRAPALASFLSSGARVEAFLSHLMLELLNAKLDFRSPTLILGVGRDESQELRIQALESLMNFASETSSFLPQRVQPAFADLCRRHLETASETCRETGDITLSKDPGYPDEESRHQQWLQRVLHLKVKLYRLLTPHPELYRFLTSIDFLDPLQRIDRIPMDMSPRLLSSVAVPLGLDSEETRETLNKLHEIAIGSLVRAVFEPVAGEEETRRQDRLYRRLVDSWVGRPALGDHLDLIDDPQQFLPDEIPPAFQIYKDLARDQAWNELGREARVTFDRAEQALRAWCERFPEITGPARLLARLLEVKPGGLEAAVRVLENALNHGFHRPGCEACDEQLQHLRLREWMVKKHFDRAVPLIMKMNVANPGDLGLFNAMVSAYSQWIEQAPDEGGALLVQIARDVDRWLDLADGGVAAKDRTTVVDTKRQLMLSAAVASIGEDLGANADWARVNPAMADVLRLDEDNLLAVRLKMVSHYHLAAGVLGSRPTPSQAEAAKHHLAEAGDLARRLRDESDDESYKSEAEKILEQVHEVLD